jgi:hypothetical protein
MGLQTVVLQYNSPNQPLGIQIKPRGSKSSPRNPKSTPGDPNRAPGVQIKPPESKSSPGGPNRAPGFQIKPLRSKSSPWRSKSSPGSQNGSSRLQADKKHHSGRVQIKPPESKSSPGGPNQAPGGPNQALGHKTGFQGCRPIKNPIPDGSLEQVRFWGFWGKLCRVPVSACFASCDARIDRTHFRDFLLATIKNMGFIQTERRKNVLLVAPTALIAIEF